MSGHAPTADEELRVIALAAALECEGPKALTGEVLAAAEEIYRFLRGQHDDDAGRGTRIDGSHASPGRIAAFAIDRHRPKEDIRTDTTTVGCNPQ
jgi:hypothetical protein